MHLVFSFFQKGEQGPSLYFHSLNTNSEICNVKGGEAFIDFITSEDNKASGTLYYLTDKYFFEKKWLPINDTGKLRTACNKTDSESWLVQTQFSLDPNASTRELIQQKPQRQKTQQGHKMVMKLVMPESCTVINTLCLKKLDKLTKYITSIVPLERDTERQQLDQFAIIS